MLPIIAMLMIVMMLMMIANLYAPHASRRLRTNPTVSACVSGSGRA
jgi:hypothetical protein